MIRFVRVSAEAVSPNETYKHLHFDTLIDVDGMVADDEAIFGIQGSLNAKTRMCAPFIIYDDDQVDYGDDDSETSNATMDVRSRPLKAGSLLELTYNGQTHPFRITRINVRLKGD
jgi:hypothetical protein